MKNKITYIRSYIIISISWIIRIVYVLLTSVGVRQHDLGYATSLEDNIINPGHLGYVEYIAKFHHLPDFDPFSIFSYYHPPLHHIIAGICVDIAHRLGVPTPQAYEFIQLPTCIYGCLSVYVAYRILRLLCDNERDILFPLALIALHPGLIYMTGTVNNDMLAALLSFVCVYTTLLWIRGGYEYKHLILMALSIGIGLISKLNVAVLIFPMGAVMLAEFIKEVKSGNVARVIKRYIVFALIAAPIGLSWSIRNILLFHSKPGISSASPESNQYLGGYPLNEIIGFPVKLSIDFPFHSENAIYCHNAWSILFKTSLYAEIFPQEISDAMLIFCRILFVAAIILAAVCFVLSIIGPIILIRRGDTDLGLFLLIGYTSVIVTYILFVIKYPYTCSCDFRYVPTSLLYAAISLIPTKRLTR